MKRYLYNVMKKVLSISAIILVLLCSIGNTVCYAQMIDCKGEYLYEKENVQNLSKYSVEKLVLNDQVVNETGQYLLICNYLYPKLNSIDRNDKKAQAIAQIVNQKIEDYTKKLFDKNCSDAKQMLEDFKGQIDQGQIPSSLLPFQLELSYDVTLNQNDYFSYTATEFEWLGGAHPNTNLFGKSYRLTDGEEIQAVDLVTLSDLELKQYIATQMKKRFEEHPEYYFDDEINKLQNLEFDYNFYLDETGIVFFFNPYEVGPYATGIVSINLSVNENKELFKDPSIFHEEIN